MTAAAACPAVAWKTFDYMRMRVPAAAGGITYDMRPALRVRARMPGSMPWDANASKAYAVGVIDSGAFATSVPMWMLDRLGIVAEDRAEAPAYSASGRFRAHRARLGMDIYHGERWQDLGTVDVIAPDTEGSRNPESEFPILLGLDGFFDRFTVCIDHGAETFQLGRIGGWS